MPRPWQKSGPPIWIGGRSEAALRRTGRLGDGWLVSQCRRQKLSRNQIDSCLRCRSRAASAGRSLRANSFLLWASSDKAFEIAGRSIRPRADVPTSEFTAFGNRDHVRAKSKPTSTPVRPSSLCALADRSKAGANKRRFGARSDRGAAGRLLIGRQWVSAAVALVTKLLRPQFSPLESDSCLIRIFQRERFNFVRTGTFGASTMNSCPSRRVRLATEQIERSSQRIE